MSEEKSGVNERANAARRATHAGGNIREMPRNKGPMVGKETGPSMDEAFNSNPGAEESVRITAAGRGGRRE